MNPKSGHKKIVRSFFASGLQSGYAVVAVLLVMVALTTFGLLAMEAGMIEMHVVRNAKLHHEMVYHTESAIAEGVQRFEDAEPIDLEEKVLEWHHGRSSLIQAGVDFRRWQDWDCNGSGEDNAVESILDPHRQIAAVEWRLATGSSIVVTEPRRYLNRIYGRYSREAVPMIMEVGYYKRY